MFIGIVIAPCTGVDASDRPTICLKPNRTKVEAMLHYPFKGATIRKYARTLPRRLSRDYGCSNTYTLTQVLAAIRDANLPRSHAHYACAMFVTREEFDVFDNGDRDYDQLREEVARVVGATFTPPCSFTKHRNASPGSATSGVDRGVVGPGGDGNGSRGA
jgi:hypothetical protein